jgi:uncharacterized membrane protein YoaK (UPF0700 family)
MKTGFYLFVGVFLAIGSFHSSAAAGTLANIDFGSLAMCGISAIGAILNFAQAANELKKKD